MTTPRLDDSRATTAATTPLVRDREFRLVFAAAAVSKLGTQVSYLALPLVAVSVLDASSGQVGLLGALSTVAFLLIGLPAGAWLDRARRRAVMVAADVARAVLLGSIPTAWWLGTLTIGQLYAVVLLAGVATVFFDVANQSFLPHLVGRGRLLAANSALVSMDGLTNVAGRSIGGLLVQTLTAPVAVVVDAVGYLWSAACLSRVRRPEPRRLPRPGASLHREVGEGVRHVFGDPVLRPIAVEGACANLAIQCSLTLLPVVFVRELGLPAGALGLYLAVGGVGALLGSTTARLMERSLGLGRALWLPTAVLMPVMLLPALIDRGLWLWLASAGWLATTYKAGVDNVLKITLRQRLTPDPLLGRMNATFRFLMTGALAVGAALAGLLGQYAGVHTALWVGTTVLALRWLLIYFSPLRTMREAPTPPSP